MAVIAGKVAPRFMGAYNSSTTYQFYDAVTHNNKLYFCKKSGTVGKAPTGATDDNWFLSLDGTFADAASLGNETAEQWQTKIDNIAGAIAKINLGAVSILESEVGTIPATYGVPDTHTYIASISPQTPTDGVLLFGGYMWTLIGMTYGNYNYGYQIGFSASGEIKFRRVYNGVWEDWTAITKQSDLTTALANYLSLSGGQINSNSVLPLILNTIASGAKDIRLPFMINGVLQGYLAFDGVNSPVFISNDGVNRPLVHGGNVGDYALIPRGMTPAASLDTVTANGTYYVNPNSTDKPHDYQYSQMLVMNNYDTIAQLFINHGNDTFGMMYRGGSNSGGFYPWKVVLDDSNVGDYALPKGGGVLTGALMFQKADNGYTQLIKNHSATADYGTLLTDYAVDGTQASLQINASRNALKCSLGGSTHDILHTGNSAKVAIQESAPTDTTSLWVDSTNKKTKACIDGAWTVIA